MKFSRYLTFGMQIIHGLEFSCFYQKNIFLVQILMIWLFCSLCSLCLVLFVMTLIFFPSLLKFLPIAIVTSSALCALFAFVDFLFFFNTQSPPVAAMKPGPGNSPQEQENDDLVVLWIHSFVDSPC